MSTSRQRRAKTALEYDYITQATEAVTEGVEDIKTEQAGDINFAGGAEFSIAHSI